MSTHTPEIIYYVAMSLDGYIAAPDGGIDWLKPFESSNEDYGYAEFYASVDGLLMGRKTYEQCLSFGEWPYPGKPSWIFSRSEIESGRDEVVRAQLGPRETIAQLAESGRRRLWLVGGGELAASLRAEGLITEYIIAVVPVLLGRGIPLLKSGRMQDSLTLVDSKKFSNGIVQLFYRAG